MFGRHRPARNCRYSSSSGTPSRTTRSPASFRDRPRAQQSQACPALHLRKNRPVSLPRSLRRSPAYHADECADCHLCVDQSRPQLCGSLRSATARFNQVDSSGKIDLCLCLYRWRLGRDAYHSHRAGRAFGLLRWGYLFDGWLAAADDSGHRRSTRASEPLVESRGGENVCPAPKPCPERPPDLSFPRSFACGHCGVDVSLDAPGTSHRNHCPSCLWSRHLDRNVPGDRKAECPGGMEPIAVTVRGERRWMLIHRCTRCGRLRMNRTAADDNVLLLIQLAALPLTTPPIPYLSPATPPGHGSRTAQRPGRDEARG